MNQKELQQKYIVQEEKTYTERDYFIDFTKCNICSSKKIQYSRQTNGIIKIICKDCEIAWKCIEDSNA